MDKKNPCVFLDVSIDASPAERIIIELFADEAPKTAENFRALCTGQMVEGKTLNYKGTEFGRIHTGAFAQGGDLSKQNSTGGESNYGGLFADEDNGNRLAEYGLLTVHRCTPGFKFYIMLNTRLIDVGSMVGFGKVIEGMETVEKIDALGTPDGKPSGLVKIVDCGEIPEEDKKKYVLETDKGIAFFCPVKRKKKLRKPSTYASEYYSSKKQHRDSSEPVFSDSEFYSTLREKVKAPLDLKKKNVMESNRGCLCCRRNYAFSEFKGKKEKKLKKAICSDEKEKQLVSKWEPWTPEEEEDNAHFMVKVASGWLDLTEYIRRMMRSDEDKKEKTISDEEEYVSSNIPNHVLEFYHSTRKYWLSTSSNSDSVFYSSGDIVMMESADGENKSFIEMFGNEFAEDKKEIVMMEDKVMECDEGKMKEFIDYGKKMMDDVIQSYEDEMKKAAKRAGSSVSDSECYPHNKMRDVDPNSYLYPLSAYSYASD